ncbi:hypothetical protein L1887_31169 [Cichorium endivia]|nr:hypothetical protein L1887_31169 [Cichorium endivia]
MASTLTQIFNRISATLHSPRRNQSPGQRTPRGNINQEKFRCYSVCVARLAIMAMLAILIGLLTLLTWHFTKVYTRTSLNALAYGLRYELLQRPMLRMWKILNSTVEITTSQVKLSEYVIRKYSKAENQAQQVELYEVMRDVTWALFASHKALNSMSIKYRNGFVQAFHRDLRDKNTYYIYSNLYNYTMIGPYDSNQTSSNQGWNDQTIHGNISAIWYREPLDPDTGRKTGKQKEIPPDELLNIAGISQVPDGAASWHVSVSKFTNSPLLSAALPVRDEGGGSIVAVVGVTTALYSVGQLMKELVELHGGHIYLTSQEGWLLATSSSTPLLRNSPSGPTLMMAVDSEDEIIQSGAKWLDKAYGGQLPVNRKLHTAAARLGHERYYIDSFFLNLTRLPMVGVLCIPRKYIMGKVDARAFKTLMILISASVCVLVVGCICIFILTNGVSKEMKLRAELISHYDARRKAEASSNFKSQFLANMSHELRTPMAAVIGLLDILLCDDRLTEEHCSTITQIRRCSTALLRLLNNILDISKVESGKLVLEEAEFDLGRELEGLVDMYSVQCKNHNVETIIDLSDDMPKVVRGDSGRVVQIFANLISNSIKFTTSGYIIVRGWCENLKSFSDNENFYVDQKALWSAFQKRLKRQGLHEKCTSCKNDNTMILYFEVEDTGCGIDPSKWESVFESFEQADPSTTRLHGGTGLGLCIVRSLVNKMGGEIKVVKKNGSGTLMQLYLLLSTPPDIPRESYQLKFSQLNLKVVLALNGTMSRTILSKWLIKLGVPIWEANEWNELTRVLQEIFKPTNYSKKIEFFLIVVDIGLLNLTTEIWKEQLNFLDTLKKVAKFGWVLNHDTSNTIKIELRRRGHLLMVNGPLYKAKMIQIIEAVKKETSPELTENTEQLTFFKDDEEEINDEEKGKIGKKCLEGLRILLAEDTPVLQRVATIMLEQMGATVVVVGDGAQAVEALNKSADCTAACTADCTPYDLVLMDCQMPKMDGYEATKAIRRAEMESKSESHIPIVALTAHAMSSDEAKCLEVGMDAYLTKPIDCKLMVSTILSLTKTQEAEDN